MSKIIIDKIKSLSGFNDTKCFFDTTNLSSLTNREIDLLRKHVSFLNTHNNLDAIVQLVFFESQKRENSLHKTFTIIAALSAFISATAAIVAIIVK